MAQPWVVGLSAGAGALAGLVAGGAAGMKLSENAATPDTRTAGIALGSAVGMFVGAFALGALVAEPGTGVAAAPGTAGIPKGLGAAPIGLGGWICHQECYEDSNEQRTICGTYCVPDGNSVHTRSSLGASPAQIDSVGWKTAIDGRNFYTDGIGNVLVGGRWYAATKIHFVPHVNGASKAGVFLKKSSAGVGTNPQCDQVCYELNDRSVCYEICSSEPSSSTHAFTAARGGVAGAPVRRLGAINSQLSPRGVGRQSFLIPPRAPGPRGPSYPVAPPSSPPSSPPIPFCPEGGTLVVVNGQYQCVWPAGAS